MLANNTGHLDLYIYGTIGSWDTDVDAFRNALAGYDNVATITVYLSSNGGYFEDGLPIYNLLKQHSAEVTVIVMGFALSMASVIMLAGDKIKAAQNSIIMIHRAQGFAFGDAEDMRKEAEIAEIHEKSIIPVYMQRMAKTFDEVFALLKAETWFNANDALEAGLIDEIIDPIEQKAIEQVLPVANLKESFQQFKNVPKELTVMVDSTDTQSLLLKILNAVVGDKPPVIPTPTEEIEMTPEELKAALAENNQQLMANVKELLATKPTDEPKPTNESESKLQAALDKISALENTVAEQANELKNLKAQAPSTDIEENAGGNDDAKKLEWI